MNTMLAPRDWSTHVRTLVALEWPQATVLSDLLTAEALHEVQHELELEKHWENRIGGLNLDRPRGKYVTSLARELTFALRNVVCDYRITSHWAIASDNGPGLGTHSDNATITCSLWLTEDVFNVSPDTGGLVIHDVARPDGMTYAEFSSFTQSKAYVKQQTLGRQMRIPYRCNTAVIFRSNLMHEVESVDFEAGDLLSRRLNLTYSWDDPDRSRARVIGPTSPMDLLP